MLTSNLEKIKSEIRSTIFNFTDYRAFLLHFIRSVREVDENWSYGRWAKTLNLGDTSSLTKIVKGDRHPGPKISEKFVKYFKFNKREARYFNDLVQWHKVQKDPHLAEIFLVRLWENKNKLNAITISQKQLTFLQHWYCLAICQMCRLKNFVEDPEWISKQFVLPISPIDCSKAMELLIEGEFLKREGKKLVVVHPKFSTENDLVNESIKKFHVKQLENAKATMLETNPEVRDFQTSFFPIKKNKIDQAKQLIREFQRKFCDLIEEEDGECVYSLQIQFLPITK